MDNNECNSVDLEMKDLIQKIQDELGIEVLAKKKEQSAPSFEQLIREKICKYKTEHRLLPNWMRIQLGDTCDEKKRIFLERNGKVTFVCNDYLIIKENDSDQIILLPDGNNNQFIAGSEAYILAEEYEGYAFLDVGFPIDEYERISIAFDGLSLLERADMLERAIADPEGFALWSSLGSVKRKDKISFRNRKAQIEQCAEEMLKRIPPDRDDLYKVLERTLNCYHYCRNDEKADYEEALILVEKLTAIALTEPGENNRCLTISTVKNIFPGALIKEIPASYNKRNGKPLNILFVAHSGDEVRTVLSENEYQVCAIDMTGVEGNDYLLGTPMSYYCNGPGILSRTYEENGTFSTIILLESLDLMGTSTRASDPVYGIDSLLRKHQFHDFFIKGIEFDLSRTQFICQVSELESCPRRLLQDMDVIVEL